VSTDPAGRARRFVAHPLVWSGLVVVLGAVFVLSDSSLSSAARGLASIGVSLAVLFWLLGALKLLRDRLPR